jgi:hypothetical protein
MYCVNLYNGHDRLARSVRKVRGDSSDTKVMEELVPSNEVLFKRACGEEQVGSPRKLYTAVRYGWTATSLLLSCLEWSERGGYGQQNKLINFHLSIFTSACGVGRRNFLYPSIVGGGDAWA